ncbi:hypothetical protein D3C78_1028260 [compost metagenome]
MQQLIQPFQILFVSFQLPDNIDDGNHTSPNGIGYSTRREMALLKGIKNGANSGVISFPAILFNLIYELAVQLFLHIKII